MLASDVLKFFPEKLAKKLGIDKNKIIPLVEEANDLFKN